MVEGVFAGPGVLEATAANVTGLVTAVYKDGFLVVTRNGNFFAVMDHGCFPGPLILVTSGLPARPAPNDRVSIYTEKLQVGRLSISLEGCQRWTPTLPHSLGNDRRIFRHSDAVVAPADLVPVWGAVVHALARADLPEVTSLLAGRGSGFTPLGDDVLIGIFLVAAIDPARRPMLRQLASAIPTTRFSGAFIRCAAEGQCIEPAHQWLHAAAAGDVTAMRAAGVSLAAVGSSSGGGVLAGMATACEFLPPAGKHASRRAVA